ncbi:ankyrin repeat-containing domain protein [Mycena vulgaris]|nr:ankyrin repeat-containing domain protein [Mycena vulgaris]
MASFSCSIPPDPDISGIGVRAAIYTQNLLSFVPAIWALWDGEVSAYELESVETQSTTILITAFAILISAMVEARTVGLSNFHANIVLSLSWMNNTNTFIYFLLYVQHKSQPEEGRVAMDLASWIKHLWGKLSASPRNGPADRKDQTQGGPPGAGAVVGRIKKPNGPNHGVRQKSPMRDFFRKIVLVLGSLHLSLMAALGIWLWSNPALFGTAKTCPVDRIYTMILGHPVLFRSTRLQAWSIGIYSLFLAPGLNLLLPMGLFLVLFLGYQEWRRYSVNHLDPSPSHTAPLRPDGPHSWIQPGLQASDESDWTFGQILALLLLVLPLRDLVETISERRETKRKAELERRENERKDQHTETLRTAIRDLATSEAMLELIERGADGNTTVEEGSAYGTVLQTACSRPDEELVARLLNHGADPNLRVHKYRSPLNVASSFGHAKSVRLLLDRGADPNDDDGTNGTPIQEALKSNAEHWDVVRLLLEHGAEPTANGLTDMTILPRAARDGQIEVAKGLLQRGVDLEARGADDATALQAASCQGHLEMVTLLLDEGAAVNAPDPPGERSGREYARFGCFPPEENVTHIGCKGGKYGTALQAASYQGCFEVVQILLEKGGHVNATGGDYGTALQAASYVGRVDIVQLLVDNRADVKVQGGKYGTALQAGAYRGRMEIVRILLETGADVNAQGSEFGTALQAASYMERLDMAQLLIDNGADVNAVAYTGQRSRQRQYRGSLYVVPLLLEKGADVNAQAGKFGTALQAALSMSQVDVAEMLLDAGADVNAQGGEYGTPLQTACRKRDTRLVKLLLKWGADPNAYAFEGGKYGTALQLAYTTGHPEIPPLLLEAGADPTR